MIATLSERRPESEAEIRRIAPGTQPGGEPPAPVNSSAKTILVVDDEAPLADLMACRLEEQGYEVLQAHDGEMALEMMRQAHPDLVITDFMMPRMTGLELARAIRAQKDYAGLPIILVSGANGSVGRDHPELFDAVLDRPHPSDQLVDQVQAVLT